METCPTVGFNVGTLDLDKKLSLTLWDVGGQRNMRTNWRSASCGCQCVWVCYVCVWGLTGTVQGTSVIYVSVFQPFFMPRHIFTNNPTKNKITHCSLIPTPLAHVTNSIVLNSQDNCTTATHWHGIFNYSARLGQIPTAHLTSGTVVENHWSMWLCVCVC